LPTRPLQILPPPRLPNHRRYPCPLGPRTPHQTRLQPPLDGLVLARLSRWHHPPPRDPVHTLGIIQTIPHRRRNPAGLVRLALHRHPPRPLLPPRTPHSHHRPH